jgi:predicted SAM-dependent methyltransferase
MIDFPAGSLLHVGSGDKRLEGWVNMDFQALPGVDIVLDVTKGLHVSAAKAVFAEHFLEHLRIEDAIAFLLEVHRTLENGAWLRLSTPNLDWVWETQYRLQASSGEKREMALAANRGFRCWGHKFLWNAEMLEEALLACGFTAVRACRYGESELEVFQGVERHEEYQDRPGLPHVIIREACKAEPQPERLLALQHTIHSLFLDHLVD